MNIKTYKYPNREDNNNPNCKAHTTMEYFTPKQLLSAPAANSRQSSLKQDLLGTKSTSFYARHGITKDTEI